MCCKAASCSGSHFSSDTCGLMCSKQSSSLGSLRVSHRSSEAHEWETTQEEGTGPGRGRDGDGQRPCERKSQ